MSVTFSRLSTTGRPRVRFGTKWLSITSTCSQSAPLTAAVSSASRAKSAARIDGAIRGLAMAVSVAVGSSLLTHLQGGGEHGIRAVAVGPQLNVWSGADVGDPLEQGPGVDRTHRMTAHCVGDHADRLGEVRRTRRIEHYPAWPGQRDCRRKQFL